MPMQRLVIKKKGCTVKAKISVLMPCYNCEKYIAEAIDSIIAQTYKNWQLLIIDDGSSDQSVDIIRKYMRLDSRILLYENEKNKGVVYTRNKALSMCEGEYIAFMDADDRSSGDRLDAECKFLDENPHISAVGGLYQLINEEGREIPTKKIEAYSDCQIRAHMLFHNVIANGTVMIRRDFILQNKLKYDENLKSTEDYRFWVDVLQVGKLQNLNHVFQFYRVHEGSLEHSGDNQIESNRKKALYSTRECMLTLLQIELSEEEKEVLFTFLEQPSSKMSSDRRKKLKLIFEKLEKQSGNMSRELADEFHKQICLWKKYTYSKLVRGLYRIWSL